MSGTSAPRNGFSSPSSISPTRDWACRPRPPRPFFVAVRDEARTPHTSQAAAPNDARRSGARPSAPCARKPSAAPRRSAPRIRSCSRCPMRARPSGTARIPPGSSSNSCCVPHLAGYRVFDERFAYLFNSYYVAAGPAPCAAEARAAHAAGLRTRSRPSARMWMRRSSG